MDIKEKTTEKLEGELKMLKVITIALIVVLAPLFIITIYGLLTKEKTSVYLPLLVVAFSCSMMIPIQYLNIIKIKKELASRN
jgi:hypothetical protein